MIFAILTPFCKFMGISYSQGKPYPIDFDQMTGNLGDCPNQFCDYNQIGKVYVIQHKVNSATEAKCAHFSIYIDIAGRLKKIFLN